MKLYKLESNRYRFEDINFSVEGKFEFISNAMVEYGVEESEIDAAMKDMATKNTDVALFGLSFNFLYSRLDKTEKYLAIELKAIESVRQEFKKLVKSNPNGPETRDAFDRLMNLYMSVNLEGVLDYIERKVA